MANLRAIRRAAAACTLALTLTGAQAVGAAVADTGRNESPGSAQQPSAKRTVVSRPKPVKAPTLQLDRATDDRSVQAAATDEKIDLKKEIADNLKQQQQIKDEIQLYRSSTSGSNIPWAKLTALALELRSLQQQQKELESLLPDPRYCCSGPAIA